LPAIVAIYISVRLADSFLDTLGKDLADVLKKAGRSVLRAVADLPSRWRRGSSTQLITPPSLSFTFEIGPHHRISFIFPPGLNDEGIEQALDAFPTALAVAISIERTILDQNGSSFHGGRATNNVYWAEQGQWVEMTAQVLMNFSKKSRGK
ncbi:MAG: hypothetical protein KGK07_02795, partial [Chloroflexota bacterium]|nr:hypothetical protein [Chloroflexota bacterium]